MTLYKSQQRPTYGSKDKGIMERVEELLGEEYKPDELPVEDVKSVAPEDEYRAGGAEEMIERYKGEAGSAEYAKLMGGVNYLVGFIDEMGSRFTHERKETDDEGAEEG